MTNYLSEIKKHFDFHRVQQVTYELYNIEKRSSYDDFKISAEYCRKMLEKTGLSDVKMLTLAADGKNTSFDCTMPQAWDLSRERSFLEVVGNDLPDCGRVLADSDIHPLHANIWSAPTPRGGITAELVDLDTLSPDNYAAAKGKWVLYHPTGNVMLCGGLYHELAEAGIAGMLVGSLYNEDSMPEGIHWSNGNGYCGWYLAREEKRFPTFAVNPIVTRSLLRKLKESKITLHGEMNCRVYDGEIYTVTGIIPGESEEEFAIMSHLYEPFPGDDACGFAFPLEFARQLIERKVKLKKTLRLIFSMELYGFSAYLKEFGKNIFLAANCDGLAFHESSDILIRHTPFFCPSFMDWIMDDIICKHLPQFSPKAEPANLSDDTFSNDPFFNGTGIPTFWLHKNCVLSHHNTGYLFDIAWLAAKEQMPVFANVFENILRMEQIPDFSKRAAKEFSTAVKTILADKELGTFEKKMRVKAEFMRAEGRLKSASAYSGGKADTGPLISTAQETEKRLATLPDQEFTANEYRALNMIVTPGKFGRPFSLYQIPFEERRPVPFEPDLWALFDGKRNLLECIRLADAELCKRTTDAEIKTIIDDLRYVAKYGYASIAPAVTLSAAEFGKVLKELGVVPGMQLIVHSTFSSLGNVPEGPEALCRELQKAVGENGTLLMPAFSFQVYLPGKYGQVYDVLNTPTATGILTETFRKMPGVIRSFDPCHSYSAWGRDAAKFVENHHLVPTIDPELSPLGILHHANGYCMTISCAGSVTFMHLVEELCGARCCGKREEEYLTIIPDGSKFMARTWRETTCKYCPSLKTQEIFDRIRKSGNLREIKLGNAHLMLFSLEDYRKAYAALMKKFCDNAAKPRKVECSVKSDICSGRKKK